MRKSKLLFFGLAMILAIALISCQTAKPIPAVAPAAPAASAIATEVDGFSPKAEAGRDRIDLFLTFGNPESIVAWKVELKSGSAVRKTLNGTGTSLPSTITWDGKGDTGGLAPEGSYTALLSVDYGSTFLASKAESTDFVLDVTPPSGGLTIAPKDLTPGAKGFLSPATITIEATSKLAGIDSWSLDIVDPSGKVIRSYSDKWPRKTAVWDGLSFSGAQPIPSAAYKALAKVRDEYGNTSELSAAIAVGNAPPAPARIIPSMTKEVSIIPEANGFSPNGDGAMDSMKFALVFGQPQDVKTWTVDILKASQVVRSYKGGASSLPASIAWDGKGTDGKVAEEGSYAAAFSIDFGSAFKSSSVKSAAFLLALSPPTGQISLSEPLFSPIESNPTITITVNASAKVAKMESWSMKIKDPAGNLFRSFEGVWPNDKVVWDGKSVSGDMVESAEDYSVAVTVRDEFGNASLLASTIPVDILVERTATGYRILSSRIFFKAYTADYADVPANLASQNTARLDQLAAKLAKFSDYKIRIVGHAVMINWNNQAKGKAEQEQVLIPLSVARAIAVAKAMVARGFNPAMIITEGVGAADQLVPDSNLVDRWRNRRVAFFLEKP